MEYCRYLNYFGIYLLANYEIIKRTIINNKDILQLMKYVDLVKSEYTNRDYSMIKVFMFGFNYTQEILDFFRSILKRIYIKGVRPLILTEWLSVKLIQYRYNQGSNSLEYSNIIQNGG